LSLFLSSHMTRGYNGDSQRLSAIQPEEHRGSTISAKISPRSVCFLLPGSSSAVLSLAGVCGFYDLEQNRLYVDWFGVIMIPTLLTATTVCILAFVAAPQWT
jgi:hypothetical protein